MLLRRVKNYILFHYKDVLIKTILIFKRFKASDSLLLLSSPRSGSTWLMEMLDLVLPTIVNFEPLHVVKGVIKKEKKISSIPYLKYKDATPENLLLFKHIFENKIHTQWTRNRASVKKTLKARYVITKFVRANLLLPFFVDNFTFKHKPIFLVRHPIDACFSRIHAFQNSNKRKINIEIPDCLNNDRYKENKAYINHLESNLEVEIAYWCMNNCPIFERLDFTKVCFVLYSDLVLTPKEELKRILHEIGFDNYINELNRINYRKASTTDFKQNLNKDPEQQLYKNINKLDKNTKDKIQLIFEHFNFKLYDAYSPFPNKNYIPQYMA